MAGPRNIRLSIGVKIAGLLAFLLMSSIATLVWLSTRLFVQDNTALIQQMNSDAAHGRATQVREYLHGTATKIQLFGTVLIQHSISQKAREQILRGYFKTEPDVLSILLYKFKEEGPVLQETAISERMAGFGDRDGKTALQLVDVDRLQSLSSGEYFLLPTRLPDGTLVLNMGMPFIQSTQKPNHYSHVLIALVEGTHLFEVFSEDDVVNSYLVDSQGTVIAHPDASLSENRVNLAQVGIVKELIGGKANNGQKKYFDPTDNLEKLGAFRQVGFAGTGVIADVSASKAFAAAKRVEFQSILLAAIILCISLLAGYVYSDSIAWPIILLAKAAQRISHGDFKVRLKPRSRDEVGYLSETFNDMAIGLEERDRVKATFKKFHSKKIAEKLLSGDVKLGGDRIEATVFFSDIRSFTSISESLEPDEVIEMLNEYITVMVDVINRHGGEVDKYVGDAIMALWGVPVPGEDDVSCAVRACLEMRTELAKLNERRLARGQEVIRIGMGLNRGELVAGNMGHKERMEYTVVGDTVNLASRLESITKTAGTDFLISGSVREAVKDKFLLEPVGAIKVKGKATAVEVFKVPGYINEDGEAVVVETPYSSYAAEASDKVESKQAA